MKRRSVIRTTNIFAVGLLGGCLGGDDENGSTDEERDQSPDDSSESETDDSPGMYYTTIQNFTNKSKTFDIELHLEGNSENFRKTYDLSAGDTVLYEELVEGSAEKIDVYVDDTLKKTLDGKNARCPGANWPGELYITLNEEEGFVSYLTCDG